MVAWLLALQRVSAETSGTDSKKDPKASHHSASGDSGLLADLGLVSASDKGGKKDSDQEKDASYEEVFSDASGAEKKAAPGKAHWPASRSDYVPPFAEFVYELKIYLETMNMQWAVAAVAAAFGIFNLLSTQTSFKTHLTLGFALIGAASAHYEVTMIWPQLNMILKLVVAAEASLLTGYIMYQSFTGAKMICGLILGLSISYFLEQFLQTETWPLKYAAGWYSAWAFIGILMLTVLAKYTLAILTPCLGGFLLSSSIGFFVKLAVFNYSASPGANIPHWIQMHGKCWLDFAGALLGGEAPAGIFGTVATPGFAIQSVDADRILGRILWFVLFYTSAKWQWKQARGQAAAKKIDNNLKLPLISNEGKGKVAPDEEDSKPSWAVW